MNQRNADTTVLGPTTNPSDSAADMPAAESAANKPDQATDVPAGEPPVTDTAADVPMLQQTAADAAGPDSPVLSYRDEYLTEGLPTPPDGGWGWMVVLGSFLIHVIADGVAYSFGVFLEDLTLYFDTGHGTTSLLGSLMIGVTWGSGPIVSALTNVFGCRVTTILGAFVASFGFIISIWAPNIVFMYFSFGIVAGLGLGLIYVPAIVSVTFYFEKRRSFATGLAVCGSGIGTFIFGPLTEVLIQHFGSWKAAVLIEAGLLLNCVVCGALFRPLEASSAGIIDVSLTEPERTTQESTVTAPSTGQPDDGEAPANSKAGQRAESPDFQARRKQVYLRSFSAMSLPHNIQATAGVTNAASMSNSGTLTGTLQPRARPSDCAAPDFASDFWIDRAGRAPPTVRHRKHHHYVSPLSRKDIFYSASLKNIPLYTEDHSEYTRRVASVHSLQRSYSSLQEEQDDLADKEAVCCGKRRPAICGGNRMSWREILDFTVFSDVVFNLFIVSNFLTSLGFCIPYVFLPDRAKLLGCTRAQGAFLISIIGISNTIGRVVFGFLSDDRRVNRLILYSTVLTLCGLCTMASSLCVNYTLLAVYAALFGCFLGVYVSITSVVLVDLMGLDKLTSSFGLTLLFQGIAAVLGPPIAGWVYDATLNYDLSFYLTGGMITISGLMLYPIEYIMKRTRKPNTWQSAGRKPAAESLDKKPAGKEGKKVVIENDMTV